MEERLLKLLDTEQLSSSKFADVIGVQRSSVSHILTGRNKPSFDFLQKTLQAFPMLNADWLILGEGEMYEGERGAVGGSLFDQPGRMLDERGADKVSGADEPSAAPAASIPPGADRSGSSADGSRISEGPGDERHDPEQQERVLPGPGRHDAPQQGSMQQGSGQQGAFPPASGQQGAYPPVSGQQHPPPSDRGQQDTVPTVAGHQDTSQQVTGQQGPGQNSAGVLTGAGPGMRKRRVSRVILFYDDNSFETYEHA